MRVSPIAAGKAPASTCGNSFHSYYLTKYTVRFFLELQYEGAAYHGWQKQPNAVSVQEVLEKALSTLLRTPTEVTGSGRTDTGVHALQQWAHFDAEETSMFPKLLYKLNSLLPHDIAVLSLHRMSDEAHARFDATSRSYRYYVHQRKNPFHRRHSYYYYRALDLEKMNEAAGLLLNYKNFRVFSKAHTDVKTYNCEVWEARWTLLPNGQYEFYIRANRFLRGMVRLITGTLLEIGAGRMDISTLKQWMDAAQPVKHKHHAGAEGLYLCEVVYPQEIFQSEVKE